MNEYVKNKKGEKRVIRIESYMARKEVIDEIIEFAEGISEKGERRSRMVYKPNYSKIDPVTIFEEKTGTTIDYYPLIVAWWDRYYIGGKLDAYSLFKDYEV